MATALPAWPSGLIPQASSMVRSRLYCVSLIVDRTAATPFEAMTSVATWPPAALPQQPAPDEPSSHVMNKTPPSRKAEEPRIPGTTLASQASPVATEQSCMSLHMFGVIQAKLGTVPLVRSARSWVNGTTCAAQRVAFVRISL